MSDLKSKDTDWGLIHSIGMFGVFAILAVSFYVLTARRAPEFHQIFLELEVDLPWMTIQWLNGTFYYPLYALMLVGILKELLIKNRVVRCTMNWFLIWTIPVYGYLFAQAVFEPLFSIVEALNS